MDFIELNSPEIGEDEIESVVRVLRSGKLAQGSEVLAFEMEFANFIGSKFAIAVNSGTSALHAGLLASGIGPGDEVIVPSFTFAASANAIALTGAKPIFADIDLDSYCISIPHVESLINKKTAGIMAVHLFGHPADLPALKVLCDKYQIGLFEDAAQAHGAEIDGFKVGSAGHFAAFSFYPTKNMTAVEGGMICTASQDLDYQSKLLRNQGMAVRYVHEIAGYNYRMTEVNAAVGRVQLAKLNNRTELRIKNANYLSSNLVGVIAPQVGENIRHVFHQYIVRVEQAKRDDIRNALHDSGIRTDIYYPSPVHSQPAYNLKLDLPNTVKACKESFAIPVHSRLTKSNLDKIIGTLNETLSRAEA
jgi:perosamine synthetase